MPLGFMPLVRPTGSGPAKPRGTLRLCLDHPLVTRNLVLAVFASEGDGLAVRDYSPQQNVWAKPGASTVTTWRGGRGQPALDFRGAVKEVRFLHRAGQPYVGNITAAFSCFAIAGQQPAAQPGTIWSLGEASDTNDVQALGFNGIGVGNLSIGDPNSPHATSTLPAGGAVWHAVGVSQTAAAARQFMVDGTLQSNATSLSSSVIGATQPHSLGRIYSNSSPVTVSDFVGFVECVFVWKIGIPAASLAALGNDPWQLVEAYSPGILYSYATPAAAPPGGFKAAWAAGSNRVLTGGVL